MRASRFQRSLQRLLVAFLGLLAAGVGWAQSPFTEVARQAGVDFTHFNGMSGELYFHEMMGAGVALFDLDNDGDLDLFVQQGSMLGSGKSLEDALIPPADPALGDRLYRNDSGTQLRFTDISEHLPASNGGYSMGVASGDVNGDGWVDLYLTRYGPNQLLLNTGKGGFRDATEQWQAQDDRWSVAASLFDYDGDGRLDLFVGNYVRFDEGNAKVCRGANDKPDYCSPQTYLPQGDQLLRNTGSAFEDHSASSGIASSYGPALGALAADFNQDGRADLYVANDGDANLLWINQGNGRFEESALMAGVAVNMDGVAEASMGVTAEDFDGDGDLDLFMTHLNRQTNTLYVNNGRGWFNDRSGAGALGSSSFAFTGFGTAWFDYDNDGLLDLISANGAVTLIRDQVAAGEVHPLRQRNQLWRQTSDGYVEVLPAGEDALSLSEVSRGLATGDLDNDGDVDVVISNNAGPLRMLRNDSNQGHHWLGLNLYNSAGHANPIGAQARIISADGTQQVRRVHSDGSYASAIDPRIRVGLGKRSAPLEVQVRWPEGQWERWTNLAVDRYQDLRAGTGETFSPERESAGG